MLFFWISCFSLILLCKSFLKPLPTWTMKMKFFPPFWFFRQLSQFFTSRFKDRTRTPISFLQVLKYRISPKAENVEEREEISLLDLPDLALECILERLSPLGLCSMGAVCSSLRERCRSDHLGERHMKQKWSRVIGDAALREWQSHIASRKRETILVCKKENKGLLGKFSSVWSIFWNRSELDGSREQGSSLPVDSIMSQYLSLERGKFWFPAQVYNRENGLVGFMLSCYDAELRYDHRTDTFRARYSSHGRQIIEDNVEWNRLRPPAVITPPTVLHVPDCLNDLKPGDHIEIQWRRNKEFSYGWWYGVVSHFELCDGSEFHCQCDSSDTVTLEFKQYAPGSRWRRTMINRKDHREVGNEADGFYGGIRKLYDEEEVSMWKQFWPTQATQ